MIKQCICQAKKFEKEAIFLTGEEDHKIDLFGNSVVEQVDEF